MKFSLSENGPGKINFAATNVAETWRRWRQNMQVLYRCNNGKENRKRKVFVFLVLNR